MFMDLTEIETIFAFIKYKYARNMQLFLFKTAIEPEHGKN